MERCSLHLVSDNLVTSYVHSRNTSRGQADVDLNALTAGLAAWLAEREPSFAGEGLSLTGWEARIDRGLAMLLRPPSRLFIDAGLPVDQARRIPIRLDLDGPMMGGSYLPARLMSQAEALLNRNLIRSVRRMREAEIDAFMLHGLMSEAVSTAANRDMGLFEASGVIDYTDSRTWSGDAQVLIQPSNRMFQQQIALALQPGDEPGAIQRVWSKLTGRSRG